MSMRERIKLIRKHFNVTQAEFATSLGLGPYGTASWEKRDPQVPTESMQLLICKTYGVNQHWLKTGEGEPFNEPSDEEVLEDILREANASPAIRSFVAAWAQLDPQQQAVLEKFVADYVADYHRRAADAADAKDAHIATSRAAEPEAPEAAQSS